MCSCTPWSAELAQKRVVGLRLGRSCTAELVDDLRRQSAALLSRAQLAGAIRDGSDDGGCHRDRVGAARHRPSPVGGDVWQRHLDAVLRGMRANCRRPRRVRARVPVRPILRGLHHRTHDGACRQPPCRRRSSRPHRDWPPEPRRRRLDDRIVTHHSQPAMFITCSGSPSPASTPSTTCRAVW